MKYAVLVSLCSLFLVGQPVIASTAAQCYETAQAHTADGGLGLTIGQANELCRGAADGSNVIRCYSKASGNPDKGGLGLTRGKALELCSICRGPITCY
jgi:hypothetical protein